jgi:thioester reductase-like protein
MYTLMLTRFISAHSKTPKMQVHSLPCRQRRRRLSLSSIHVPSMKHPVLGFQRPILSSLEHETPDEMYIDEVHQWTAAAQSELAHFSLEQSFSLPEIPMETEPIKAKVLQLADKVGAGWCHW